MGRLIFYWKWLVFLLAFSLLACEDTQIGHQSPESARQTGLTLHQESRSQLVALNPTGFANIWRVQHLLDDGQGNIAKESAIQVQFYNNQGIPQREPIALFSSDQLSLPSLRVLNDQTEGNRLLLFQHSNIGENDFAITLQQAIVREDRLQILPSQVLRAQNSALYAVSFLNERELVMIYPEVDLATLTTVIQAQRYTYEGTAQEKPWTVFNPPNTMLPISFTMAVGSEGQILMAVVLRDLIDNFYRIYLRGFDSQGRASGEARLLSPESPANAAGSSNNGQAPLVLQRGDGRSLVTVIALPGKEFLVGWHEFISAKTLELRLQVVNSRAEPQGRLWTLDRGQPLTLNPPALLAQNNHYWIAWEQMQEARSQIVYQNCPSNGESCGPIQQAISETQRQGFAPLWLGLGLEGMVLQWTQLPLAPPPKVLTLEETQIQRLILSSP